MSRPESHHKLMHVVEHQKLSSGILCSAYFATLQNSEMSRSTFESTQQQFFYAVRFFSRAMAALAARITDSATRLPLIHNLAEEHGLTDEVDAPEKGDIRTQNAAEHHPFHPVLAHDRTFLAFLDRLKVASPATGQDHIERPAVRAFNLALWAACAIEHPSTAFACLGAIEYAFADISALIGNCIVDRGWMSHDKLVHYKLHAEIDKRHAGDFFSVVVSDWTDKAAGRPHVESGLSLGFYLFRRLYDDLLTEATNHE
jgi:pyrroloquinoline-quinone synthase